MPSTSELRELAKDRGLKGYSNATKAELLFMNENNVTRREARERMNSSETVSAPAPEKRAEVQTADQPSEQAETKPSPVETPAPKPKRRNVWNEYLSSYIKEHNCSLAEARANKEAYAKYKSSRVEN